MGDQWLNYFAAGAALHVIGIYALYALLVVQCCCPFTVIYSLNTVLTRPSGARDPFLRAKTLLLAQRLWPISLRHEPTPSYQVVGFAWEGTLRKATATRTASRVILTGSRGPRGH